MNDDFLTFIEEDFVRCTKCEDYKYINSVTPIPCPNCNYEEYKEFVKERLESEKLIKKKR